MMTLRRSAGAVLLLTCGFLAGTVSFGVTAADAPADAQAAPAPAQGRGAAVSPRRPTGGVLPDFTDVAARTVPAVVNVSSQQVVRRRADPLMEFLYGDRAGREAVTNSLGSGVIVTPDGYILTNNHVVTGEGRAPLRSIQIRVTLSDKREFPATVVGVDPGTDLALLKVDGTNLPVMPWGNSDTLRVAEWVLAIGNPYELNETVTLGIVSALNRTNVGINDFENFIQTDAAINPGNSGGALVNSAGELVGINTAIFSQSGGYQGIGFAVASNLARQVMNDLREHGQVVRGTIWGLRLTTRLAQEVRSGAVSEVVVVSDVLPDSAAGRAGFQRGDIIIRYNDTEFTEARQLVRLIGETPIGSTAAVTVLRRNQRVVLSVPIEQPRPQRR